MDESGRFGAKLDGWETQVLEQELANPRVIGWLRNLPRKDWAICVPYRMSQGELPLYPDFVVFRSVKGKPVADLLDPHSTSLADAVPKIKGLAEFASKHVDEFGRIESIVVNSHGEIKRLDMKDPKIQVP